MVGADAEVLSAESPFADESRVPGSAAAMPQPPDSAKPITAAAANLCGQATGPEALTVLPDERKEHQRSPRTLCAASTSAVRYRGSQIQMPKIGGSPSTIRGPQIMWVRMGASTPPVALRCSPQTVPRIKPAKASMGLPVANVAAA